MEAEPFLAANYLFFYLAATPSLWSTSIGIMALLVCSALISGSEVAFFSLDDNDLKNLEEEKTKAGNRIMDLLKTPRYLLATILISNNFVNIAIVILSYFLLQGILSEGTIASWSSTLLEAVPALERITSTETVIYLLDLFITTGVATFILVLFGEVAPKVYANLNRVQLAKFMALPLMVLRRLFKWFSSVLVNGVGLVERRLEHRAKSTMSKEAIDEAINLTLSEQANSEQEVDILRSIVQFGNVPVKHIMCSRVDIIAVPIEMVYQELLNIIRDSGYSRIPVYEGDLDRVTGILYAKDLIGHLQEGSEFEWQQLIRTPVMFVPEAKKIDDLLREFQTKRTHMAIVVDEYGGSAGLVTLEDIMEEIIGDIRDEFDDEIEVEYRQIDEHTYEFEGKTLINDFCRVIGVDTTTFDTMRGESDSLAGMILQITGKFPRKNDVIRLGKYKFKVTGMSKRRIEYIRVSLPEK